MQVKKLSTLEDLVRYVDFEKGVKQKFRGHGINLAMGAHSYLGTIGRGYNVLRNFVVYRKELSGKY